MNSLKLHKKRFIALSIVLFIVTIFSLPCFGQYKGLQQGQAMVYYMDGSVFIGNIIEKNEFELILLVSTGDTLHLKPVFVKRVFDTNEVLIFRRGKYHRTDGFFGVIDFGVAPSPVVEGSLLLGKRIYEKYAVGAGAALSTTTLRLNGEWMWHDFHTYFVYGRYYLNHKQRRLFADARLGYGFPRNGGWNDPHSGGIHFQPGITLLFASRNNFRFFAGISQYMQYTSGEFFSWDPFIDYEGTYSLFYNRTIIKIGFQFH